jgi:hypothetical protein
MLSNDDFCQEVTTAHEQLQELRKEAREFLRKLPKMKHFADQRDRVSRYLRYRHTRHAESVRRVGLVRNGRNSQIEEFYSEFRRFTEEVLSAFAHVAAVLPRHEVEALRKEIDPGKIEITCRAVERAAERGKEFSPAPPTENKPKPDREAWLQEFIKNNKSTIAAVNRAAQVHKPDMRKWRRGKYPDESVISGRIEDVLNGTRPLKSPDETGAAERS